MMLTRKGVEKQLDELRAEQETLATQFVIQEARKLLVRHARLKEFVMCMGSWFFLDQQGLIIHDYPSYLVDSTLATFISRWDEELKITGEPMRFTVDGPIVRDWGAIDNHE